MTIKPKGPTHAEIWDGEKWIATVSLEGDKDRAEKVKRALEQDEDK